MIVRFPAVARCTSNGATDGELLLGGPVQHVFDAVIDLDELDGDEPSWPSGWPRTRSP